MLTSRFRREAEVDEESIRRVVLMFVTLERRIHGEGGCSISARLSWRGC